MRNIKEAGDKIKTRPETVLFDDGKRNIKGARECGTNIPLQGEHRIENGDLTRSSKTRER